MSKIQARKEKKNPDTMFPEKNDVNLLQVLFKTDIHMYPQQYSKKYNLEP